MSSEYGLNVHDAEKNYKMNKERCGRCHCLGWMNTRDGKRNCCKWFWDPQLLDNVDCEFEQHGGFVVVLPRIKGHNFDPNL